MSSERERRLQLDPWGLDLESSRLLDKARIIDDGLCWWCRQRPATTGEHKFKATDLRRMADPDAEGRPDPGSLWKGGGTFSGELRTLKRGTAVQWKKSMCKACNGGRDRDMDEAYDVFSEHLWTHQDELGISQSLDWRQLFGDPWQPRARDVARFYAKQVGCMFSQQRLPVPPELIAFLDGADTAPNFVFTLVRDRGRMALHRQALRDDIDARGYWLPPSQLSLTPDGRSLVTFSHQPYIGFIGVSIDQAPNLEHPSFFDVEQAPLVTVTGANPLLVRAAMKWGALRERLRRRFRTPVGG